MSDPELRADPSVAEIVVSGFLPDPSQRWVALKQLVATADYAATVAPAAWGVTLYRDIFRLNVGRVEALVVGSDFIRLNCIGQVGKSPFVGSRFESSGYRSVPDPKCAFVGPLDEFAAIEANLQASHFRFIDAVGRKKNGASVSGSGLQKSHSEGLIVYARAFISSSERTEDIDAYWTSDDEVLPERVKVEGARLTLQVNVFERNAAARSQCLDHYGSACVLCAFTSERKYGAGVVNLIHVHHIRPLSEIGEEYVVDPIADLRPVCPNCHAVIHSRNPPYSLAEVASMLTEHRASTSTGDDA